MTLGDQGPAWTTEDEVNLVWVSRVSRAKCSVCSLRRVLYEFWVDRARGQDQGHRRGSGPLSVDTTRTERKCWSCWTGVPE